jgi:hypothetical protein
MHQVPKIIILKGKEHPIFKTSHKPYAAYDLGFRKYVILQLSTFSKRFRSYEINFL